MQSESIWLDKLPLDVCVRIASSAQVSDHRAALNLAQASPVQQAALKNAVQRKLDLLKIAEQCCADLGEILLTTSAERNASDHGSADCSDHHTGSSADAKNSEQCNVDETHPSSKEQSETASTGNDSEHEEQAASVGEREHSSEVGAERLSVEEKESSFVEGSSDNENETVSTDEGEQSPVVDRERCSVDETDTCSENQKENSSDDDRNISTDEDEQRFIQVLKDLQTGYATLLGDETAHICIDGADDDVFTQPTIQSCLKSATLRKLYICGVPDSLHSVQYGTNIRALQLLVDDCHLLSIIRGFSSLQLRELKLQTSGDKCLHHHFTDDPQSHPVLAGFCPSVEVLALECAFCGEDEKPPWFLWNVMDKFPNLREVTLSEAVPDSAIERLRKMDRIKLIAGDTYGLARKLPESIISITSSRLWTKTFSRRVALSPCAFEKLANCPKLEELNCVIAPDALSGLVHISKNLRSLGVAFQVDDQGEGRSERGPVRLEPKYGVLLDVVKSAPLLKSLHLINMRVQREELREMLIVAGKRLEEFEEEVFAETFFEQFCSYGRYFMLKEKDNKQELEEFANTLRTAALHNPKLRKFKLDLRAGWFTDLDAVQDSMPEIVTSYNVLRRHAVGLDVRPLNRQMLKFASGEIGLLDVMPSLGLDGIRIPGGMRILTF